MKRVKICLGMILCGALIMVGFVKFTDYMPDGIGGMVLAAAGLSMLVLGGGWLVLGGAPKDITELTAGGADGGDEVFHGDFPAVIVLGLMCTWVYIMTGWGGVELTRLSIDPGKLPEQWYRCFSYMFAHLGVWHFLGNMFILFTVARRGEQYLGSRRFTMLYFAGGIAGAAAELFTPGTPEKGIVGASGALYCVTSYMLVVCFRDRSGKYKGFLRWLCPIALAGLAETVIMPDISLWCHLGGAVFGLAAGMFGAERVNRE